MVQCQNFQSLLKDLNMKKSKWLQCYLGGYFRTHKKMDSNLLKKAVSVGLDYMNVGTENGTNKILALMEKGQTAEDVSFFLKSAYEAKAF